LEKQNPSTSVKVLCCGDESGSVSLYVSKQRDRFHHANIFQLEEQDDTCHYV